jgi:hypothetical protein
MTSGHAMNRVVQFDQKTMSGEQDLARLLVEFDERGRILREIGIGHNGRIAHRFPGKPSLDDYGLMSPNVIAIKGENPSPYAVLMDASNLVHLQLFEELWRSE